MKRCAKCATERPLTEFYRNRRNQDGLHYSCKRCMNAATAKWRSANLEKRDAYQRDYDLRRHYGITAAEWDALFESQGRGCAICGDTDPTPVRSKWHTEHDHATGQVRGITCPDCNFLLRFCHEDPSRLYAAAAYLERAVHA